MDFSPISDYIESFFRTEKGVHACEIEIRRSHETLFRYRTGYFDAADTVDQHGRRENGNGRVFRAADRHFTV